MIKAVLISVTALAIIVASSGCSLKMPRVHKISVQQGNVITQEMIDQLKPGMSRSQVAYIMGEPILRNTFNENRWDYIYTIEIPGFFNREARMALYFENDVLAYFTGDLAPSAAIASKSGSSNDTSNGPTTENNDA